MTTHDEKKLEPSQFDHVFAWMLAANLLCSFLLITFATIWYCTFDAPLNRKVIVGITVSPIDSDDEPVEDDWVGDLDFPGFTEVSFETLESSLPRIDEAIAELSRRAAQDGQTGDANGGILGGGPGKRLPKSVDPPNATDRWMIHYHLDDLGGYAQQLEHFGIQIGVVLEEEQTIWRVSNLTGGKPTLKKSTRQRENQLKSVYFLHPSGRVKRWSQAIAESAGVSMENAFTVEFYPLQTVSELAQLESAEVLRQGRSVDEVAKTEFKLKQVDGGFRFVVHNVEYR
ncbi:MAG: hypothetical protein AAFN77_01065 [Planctomycetota bacterium]